MPTRRRLLDQHLRALRPEEIRSFDEHFTDCLDRAYTWEMWDEGELAELYPKLA